MSLFHQGATRALTVLCIAGAYISPAQLSANPASPATELPLNQQISAYDFNPLSLVGTSRVISKQWVRHKAAEDQEARSASPLLGKDVVFGWKKLTVGEYVCDKPQYAVEEVNSEEAAATLQVELERVGLKGDSLFFMHISCATGEPLPQLEHIAIDRSGTAVSHTARQFLRLSENSSAPKARLDVHYATEQALTANETQPAVLPLRLRDNLILRHGTDPEEFLKTLATLRQAVGKNDKWAVARLVKYPLYVALKHEPLAIKNRTHFVQVFEDVMTNEVRATILQTEPAKFVVTERGVLLGSGVWISAICANVSCEDKELRITGLG